MPATMEDAAEKLQERQKLVEAASFVLKKFLAKTSLWEKEEKILETELRELEQTLKVQKIKSIINKNDS